jgi:hypothetical protein
MGFMTAECGIAAFVAALIHILGHGLYKATAFLDSATVEPIAPWSTRLSGIRTVALLALGLVDPCIPIGAMIEDVANGRVQRSTREKVAMGKARRPTEIQVSKDDVLMHGAPHPLYLFLIPAFLPSGHRVDVLEVAQHHTPRIDSFRIFIDVNNKALDHPLPLDLGCAPVGKTLKEDKTARIGLEGLCAQLRADAKKVFSLELLDPLMHLTNEKLGMGESVRPHPIQEVSFDVIAQRGHWQLIYKFRRILKRCPCPTTTTSALRHSGSSVVA